MKFVNFDPGVEKTILKALLGSGLAQTAAETKTKDILPTGCTRARQKLLDTVNANRDKFPPQSLEAVIKAWPTVEADLKTWALTQ